MVWSCQCGYLNHNMFLNITRGDEGRAAVLSQFAGRGSHQVSDRAPLKKWVANSRGVQNLPSPGGLSPSKPQALCKEPGQRVKVSISSAAGNGGRKVTGDFPGH